MSRGLSLSLARARRRRGAFDPRQIPQLTKWLSWSGATDTGTFSLPDVLGGDPATQSTGSLKPTVTMTSNGVKVGSFNADVLSLPLSAAINDNTRFGMAFWAKLNAVSGLQTFASVQNLVGGSSATRLTVNTFGGSLQTRATTVDRRADIPGLDTNWRFCYVGIDCSKGSEAAKVLIAVDGVFGTVNFTNDTAWPSSLATPTGNMLIGDNQNPGGTSPLGGSIGDIYFFRDQFGVVDLGRLKNFNRPL